MLTGPFCRFCGSAPAVQATFRGHRGLVLYMKFLWLEGPFCRSCGIATHRQMTAKSLWQGWWGPLSMLVNPITMLVNLPHRHRVNRLAEPIPGAPGRPMDLGKPVYRRAAVLGFLVLPAVIALLVGVGTGAPSEAAVGDCVLDRHGVLTGAGTGRPALEVVDCSGPEAEATVIGRVEDRYGAGACTAFPGTDAAYTEERFSIVHTLCLRLLKP